METGNFLRDVFCIFLLQIISSNDSVLGNPSPSTTSFMPSTQSKSLLMAPIRDTNSVHLTDAISTCLCGAICLTQPTGPQPPSGNGPCVSLCPCVGTSTQEMPAEPGSQPEGTGQDADSQTDKPSPPTETPVPLPQPINVTEPGQSNPPDGEPEEVNRPAVTPEWQDDEDDDEEWGVKPETLHERRPVGSYN